jgi:hypothetical protein
MKTIIWRLMLIAYVITVGFMLYKYPWYTIGFLGGSTAILIVTNHTKIPKDPNET